jgi:hypothetical protein
LFTEEELQHDDESLGCVSAAGQLRDRLQPRGFTAPRSRAELVAAVRTWHGTIATTARVARALLSGRSGRLDARAARRYSTPIDVIR